MYVCHGIHAVYNVRPGPWYMKLHVVHGAYSCCIRNHRQPILFRTNFLITSIREKNKTNEFKGKLQPPHLHLHQMQHIWFLSCYCEIVQNMFLFLFLFSFCEMLLHVIRFSLETLTFSVSLRLLNPDSGTYTYVCVRLFSLSLFFRHGLFSHCGFFHSVSKVFSSLP